MDRLPSWLSPVSMCSMLVWFLLVVWPPTAAFGAVCTAGTVLCEGPYGASCYNPAYATCVGGVICGRSSAFCSGRYGAGCYNPAYATCYDGLVCARPLQPCIGRAGAQCYAPGQATCETSSTPRPAVRDQQRRR